MISLFINFSNLLLSQTVSTQKSVFSPGEKIIVNYSGFPNNAQDWIGVVPVAYRDEQLGEWFYTNGAQSGTMTFNALTDGEYEVRGYFNNQYVVKARQRFRVGNVLNTIVKTQKDVYAPNEGIVINYSGFPGNTNDWINVVPASYKDEQLAQWFLTDGNQSGNMNFTGLPVGNYEVRAYFNNEYKVRARYPFVVSSKPVAGACQKHCRSELSVFYAGMGGLGSAWARTANEPTVMTAEAVLAIQGVLGNARDALNVMRMCIRFDITKLNTLISRMPSLTNVQAESEIQALIRELQTIIAQSTATCDRGATLSSLFVTGVHVGAAQGHASGRQCQPAPMPMAFQTVIRNHLNTARDAFAAFLGCVPGFSLSQFDSVPLGSMNSIEAHTHIVGLHTNILWNISLSDCCCCCR